MEHTTITKYVMLMQLGHAMDEHRDGQEHDDIMDVMCDEQVDDRFEHVVDDMIVLHEHDSHV